MVLGITAESISDPESHGPWVVFQCFMLMSFQNKLSCPSPGPPVKAIVHPDTRRTSQCRQTHTDVDHPGSPRRKRGLNSELANGRLAMMATRPVCVFGFRVK